jgi:hypothetical protein
VGRLLLVGRAEIAPWLRKSPYESSRESSWFGSARLASTPFARSGDSVRQ